MHGPKINNLEIKFFVDLDGNYYNRGCYCGTIPDLETSVEVPYPPDHGWKKWDFSLGKYLDLTEDRINEMEIYNDY